MDLPATKGPSWLLLCTGGLMTTGGLGKFYRVALSEQPKPAVVAFVASSAGFCLMNMSFYVSSEVIKIPRPNWWLLLTGGILAVPSFKFCVDLALQEHSKSTFVAFITGAIGYCIGTAAIFKAVFGNGKKTLNNRGCEYRLSPKEIADLVDSAKARFNYMGANDQCPNCKVFVDALMEKKQNILKSKNNGLHLKSEKSTKANE